MIFVADDGALTCGKPAQKLEGIVSLNWPINFIGQGDYVIFPTDGHTGISLARNISYTPGTILLGCQDAQLLYGELKEWYDQHCDSDHGYTSSIRIAIPLFRILISIIIYVNEKLMTCGLPACVLIFVFFIRPFFCL